ncbi:MAG: FAD-dependent oxidoreductase, partial [Hyphomicrobium sp.]
MTGQYDVIVIGAGLGGLTAAALLAQAGRKTLLVERN